MKKKIFICILIAGFISNFIISYEENGNGYPHSYDTGVYSNGENESVNNNSNQNNNNNSNQPQGPNIDSEGIEIESEAEELNSQINEEQSEVESIEAFNVDNSNPADVIAAEESLNNEAGEAIASTEAEIGENIESSTNEENGSNSTETGDPVKISKGTYELSESDFIIGSNKLFMIKRNYDSGRKITGSFGLGWNTNLDERIILGTRPAHHNDVKSMNDYVHNLRLLISLRKVQLSNMYHVSDIYNAPEEINNKIQNCELYCSKMDTIISKLNKLKDRAGSREGLRNKISEYIEKASDVKREAENKKELLNLLYEKSKIEISVLMELEHKFQQAHMKLEEMKVLMQESKERNEHNKKVMFNGMAKFYEETGLDTITVIDAEGFPHILKEENKIWKNQTDKLYKYCEKSDNQFLLYEKNGTVKCFNENGFLISVTDRNGNVVEIIRNPSEEIVCIKTSDNECFDFKYENGFIKEIKNSRSEEEKFVYDYLNNKLISVKDSDGDQVEMNYDSNNHLISLSKCDGSKVQFKYDVQTFDGKTLITETTNEEGDSEYFEYSLSEKRTDYIDHDGNKFTYFYDDKHRTVQEYHPDGTIIKYEYDDSDNPVLVNINGNLIRNEYDGRGNKIKTLFEDSSTEHWEYDNFNLITVYVNRDGVKEEFIRDDTGNVVEYRKGGKTVYTQSFNSKGQVIKKCIYSEQTEITEFYYDSFGNLKKEISDTTNKEYEYDNRNRLIKYTFNGLVVSEYVYSKHEVTRKDYNGLITTCKTNGRKDIDSVIQKDNQTGKIHQLCIEYDKRHLPVRVFIGDEKNETQLIECSYTPEGKLSSEIIYGTENIIKDFIYKNGLLSEVRQYKEKDKIENAFVVKYNSKIYGKNQKTLTVSKLSGVEEIFEYDSYGNIVRSIDGNGNEILYKFTKSGLLSSKQSDFGGWYDYFYASDGMLSCAGERGKKQINLSYYTDGKIREVKDRYGKVTEYHYDKLGRIRSVQSERQKIWYEYDLWGRIVKKITGPSAYESDAVYFVSFDYSRDGHAVSVCEGGKYKTTRILDSFGNVIKVIDGNNNERSFVYNERNQIIESVDGYGNQTFYEYDVLGNICHICNPDKTEINYRYNCLGLLEEIRDDCGCVYKAEYDKAGRLIKEKKRAEGEKQYEYDNSNRLLKIICNGDVLQSYSYRDNGRILSANDGNNNSFLYYYDSYGRLTSEQNRNGNYQTFSYDEEGSLIAKRDFENKNIKILYSSDRSIKTFVFSDGSENRFIYDSKGNVLEARNENGKNIYSYDQGGKLIYQKDLETGEEICYEYDAAGNKTSLRSSNCNTKYLYGKNNEIKEIFDNKQNLSVKLQYDKNGREVLRKYGNGTKEETLYDRAGRVIVKMLKSERNELVWGEGYVYNDDGKRIASVDNNARITLYEYNSKGQLSTVYYPCSEEIINIQKNEAQINGLQKITSAGENKFLTSSEKNAIIPLLNSMQYGLAYKITDLQVLVKESYSYDLNGNRISKVTSYGTIEYKYDKENCLISSGSRGQPFVNYTNDKMGNLLSEESSEKKVRYTYNAQNRLVACESRSFSEKEYAQTTYAYDAFGRRVLTQDKGQTALRSIYDGLTFDVIKQGPVYATTVTSSQPTGDRYRYLDENETYKNNNSRYYGERTHFYVNGSLAAQACSDYGMEYFTTDQQGSIRVSTDGYGMEKSAFSYDAFGSLITGNLSGTNDNGYLAKSLEPTSKFYNYGYRDYNPKTSRFTTSDPIRDGSNWFAYCNGDPVNFVDLYGLFFYKGNTQESYKQTTVYVIRNHDGTGNEFNSSMYIRKEDVYGNVTYSDPYTVGANCKQEYNGTIGSTTPDGNYYLSGKGTYDTPLYAQDDGSTNSTSYKNVLSLRTNDPNLTQNQRDMINTGDRLLHADEKYNSETGTTTPYNSDGTPGGAGCIISHTQTEQDKMMAELMDGVTNPESVLVTIYSLNNEGCGN
ncbi:RHS repeat-associated core domain-containing protein [Treponema bryantii]|uniref:RHS repeat-associated core domain-containing protein n=1 Tax=Treponema bryantii TaxID=163 RepID=UPI002B2E209B|nr:hypothetical protein TRBR_21380 [Treponema bryantii]